ncbi:MAG: hypothetical protein ABIP68_06605 [Ferruginibacter sp.]
MNPYLVLRNKFPEGEYVLISEVPDNVSSRNRYLDYMVINLWASRGLSVTGIERKSNRGDWLNEIKNPKKQENHFKYCEYFYLLTDREGVAKIEEIPETWGWYHITDKGILKTIKAAPKLQSEPIPRVLLCAMLRRAQDKAGFIHKDTVQDHINNRVEEIIEVRTKELQEKSKKYFELLNTVREFEKFSGISLLHAWSKSIEGIGEAVRVITLGGVSNYLRNFKSISEQIKLIDNTLVQRIEILEKLESKL